MDAKHEEQESEDEEDDEDEQDEERNGFEIVVSLSLESVEFIEQIPTGAEDDHQYYPDK